MNAFSVFFKSLFAIRIENARARFLLQHFFEFSFRGKKPNRKVFDSIKSSAELHFIADRYNWDDGPQVLQWIINSNLCDAATAKLIFWRAEPIDYTLNSVDETDFYDREVVVLLQNIIANFESGFYKKHRLFYDPRWDYGWKVNVDWEEEDAKWQIPEHMKTKVNGRMISYSI